MSPPNNNENGNGRGPPDHVTERDDGTLEVGKSRREKCEGQATCDDQQDRIEAKLDLILAELDVEY